MPAEIPNEGKNASLHGDHRPMGKADEIPSDFTNNKDVQNSPLRRVIITPIVVHLSGPDEVENERRNLPIVMLEQVIMEAINENPAVIVCGETGCAGFGSNKSSVRSDIIGVNQPRRVAVLGTAKSVAFELSLCLGKEVGFQVRHEKKIWRQLFHQIYDRWNSTMGSSGSLKELEHRHTDWDEKIVLNGVQPRRVNCCEHETVERQENRGETKETKNTKGKLSVTLIRFEI